MTRPRCCKELSPGWMAGVPRHPLPKRAVDTMAGGSHWDFIGSTEVQDYFTFHSDWYTDRMGRVLHVYTVDDSQEVECHGAQRYDEDGSSYNEELEKVLTQLLRDEGLIK